MADSGIVEAYLGGLAARRQKEQVANEAEYRKNQLEQQKAELEQRKNELKELANYHERENARLEAQNAFIQASQKLTQQDQLRKEYEESGVTPSGYSEDESAAHSVPIGEGIAGTSHSFTPANPLNPGFTSLDPETSALLAAKRQSIINAPLFKQQVDLKQMEEDAKLAAAQINHSNDLEKIRLQNQGRNEAAAIRGRSSIENKLDVPFDPKTQRDEFGLSTYDPTLTPRKAQQLNLIKPLTPAQESQEAAYSDLLLDTNKLKGMLEATDPKTGKPYYESYYGGLFTGTKNELKSRIVNQDPQLDKIRQLAADIELKSRTTVDKLRSNLSPHHQAMLEKQTPSPDRSLTSGRAKSIVEGFYDELNQARGELVSAQKTGNKAPGIIRHDADGNVIP